MEKVIFDLISTFQFFKYCLGYNLFVRFGWPKILPSFFIFSVNNYCNQRCKTCNIWKKNHLEEKRKELNLEEICTIFSKFPKIFWLTIGGGEPFLREDLVDVVRIAYEKSKVNVLTLATNGSLPSRIEKSVKEILRKCKNLTVLVNVSIDGNKELHDKIRGIKGSFDNAVETINRLKKIKSRRLIVGVNTTLSLFNIGNLDKLIATIEKINPDSFVLCIAQNRERFYNIGLNISPKPLLSKEIIAKLKSTLKKKKGVVGFLKSYLRSKYYVYILHPGLVKNKINFEGIASVYLMSDGTIRVGETSNYLLGNLRACKYNACKLLFSKKSEKYRHLVNSFEYKKNLTENAFCVMQLLNTV